MSLQSGLPAIHLKAAVEELITWLDLADKKSEYDSGRYFGYV